MARILLVDDDESLRNLYSVVLKEAGHHEVITASNGLEALDVLAREPVELVFTDLRMPVMDGVAFMGQARLKYPWLGFVVATGFPPPESIKTQAAEGSLVFMFKPVMTAEMLAATERALEYCRTKIIEQFGDGKTQAWDLAPLLAVCGGDKARAAELLGVDVADLDRTPGTGMGDRDEAAQTLVELQADQEAGDFETEGLESRDEGSATGGVDQAAVCPFLVGGLIHDSLNTIGALIGYTEYYERHSAECPDPATAKLLARIKRSTEHLARAQHVIQSISREYYKPAEARSVSPEQRIEEIVAGFRQEHPTITYESSVGSSCEDSGLPFGAVMFLVGELLQNASKACSGKEGATVGLSVGRAEDGSVLSIECCDSGPGFPPAILEGILDRSIRAPRAPGAGGYGLYLMLQIVQRLEGGTMLASNLEPSGARIQLLLPFGGGVA